MLKTADNPDGLPIEVFDQIRNSSLTDRSQLYKDFASGPFFGANFRIDGIGNSNRKRVDVMHPSA